MTQPSHKDQTRAQQQAKKEHLAKALRANLLRRKAAPRTKKA